MVQKKKPKNLLAAELLAKEMEESLVHNRTFTEDSKDDDECDAGASKSSTSRSPNSESSIEKSLAKIL